MSAPEVCKDLAENHHRPVAQSYLQNMAESISAIAQAKEEYWEYCTPKIEEAISIVTISLDGAQVLTREDGWRETMVGAVSLYDSAGERHHSIYLGESPEYGKATFKERMDREINHVKNLYPNATYVGIADGAKDNWSYLEKHTEKQVLDFYHVTEYLSGASEAAHAEEKKQEYWLDENCSTLKHERGGVGIVFDELKKLSRKRKTTETVKEKVGAAVTYFKNNILRMNYSEILEENIPIGSGVTEAACKTLVKQRLCGSGMRWKKEGIKTVLSLRELVLTPGRWDEFWNKMDQYGTSIA
jgi:hypothetical protein